MIQRIQIAPVLSTRTRDTELMDLGLGLDFESWRELYGSRLSGVAVDNSRLPRRTDERVTIGGGDYKTIR